MLRAAALRVDGVVAAAKRHERVRTIARRAGLLEPVKPQRPPRRPIGAKLELTHACNLRCGFCYTDSPRHTLQRTPELSDEQWLRIVEQVVDLGVLEAVVTGGEPLLRRELTLSVLERLSAARINLTLNTNGWFVDEAVANRLAAVPALRVHVSLDGPTPQTHERARGVPGSWRRAVRAIGLLVDRGVPVQVAHLVTPDNEDLVAEMVRQAWTLGADSLRVMNVVPIGGAARAGDWCIHEPQLRKRVEAACAGLGSEFAVHVTADCDPATPRVPASILVRPNAGVQMDSINPFRFGDALEDGLAECWDRIVRDWDHPRATVPFAEAPAPPPAASTQADGIGDLDAAHRHIAELGLGRRYRLGDARFSDGDAGERYVRLPNAEMVRLNATAVVVMDACAEGTARDAVARLVERFPAQSPQELEQAALGTVRRLTARGILSAAGTRNAP